MLPSIRRQVNCNHFQAQWTNHAISFNSNPDSETISIKFNHVITSNSNQSTQSLTIFQMLRFCKATQMQFSQYSKTPIYRAPIYRKPRFTAPKNVPPILCNFPTTQGKLDSQIVFLASCKLAMVNK